MKALRQNAAIFGLCCALGLLGCQHKKPVLVMPQQQPPTAAPSPSPTPEPSATEQQPAEQTQTQPAQTASSEPEKTEPPKEKPRHGKKPSPRKPAQASGEKPAEVARNTPRKIIPPEKATPTPTPGQISPGPTPNGGAQDQNATEQLLQSAESNLNGIKRQLNKEEEAVRAQIREFISQSRKAITENDPDRAHKLAVKARLLSDDLARQR
jgi:hypothetical protein